MYSSSLLESLLHCTYVIGWLRVGVEVAEVFRVSCSRTHYFCSPGKSHGGFGVDLPGQSPPGLQSLVTVTLVTVGLAVSGFCTLKRHSNPMLKDTEHFTPKNVSFKRKQVSFYHW